MNQTRGRFGDDRASTIVEIITKTPPISKFVRHYPTIPYMKFTVDLLFLQSLKKANLQNIC